MNFSYEPTISDPSLGSLILSSSTDFDFVQNFNKRFSWNVGGFLSVDKTFVWNVGDGEYYWYRVEGECKKVICENFNVNYESCESMTFMTVVPARNLEEVCQILDRPRLNPPVRTKIYSIKRYSRPIAKSNATIDDCNVLEDEYFCQIPECFNYCIDHEGISKFSFEMKAIEASYYVEASGFISISGISNNNRYFHYSSDSSLVVLSGSSESEILLEFYSLIGNVVLGGKSLVVSSNYNYYPSSGVTLGGLSSITSPYRFYASKGSAWLSGSGFIFPLFRSSVQVYGSAEILLSKIFDSSGAIYIEGILNEHSSPSYNYEGFGGINLTSTQPSLNFGSLGVLVSRFGFDSFCPYMKSDLNGVSTGPELTISDSVIETSCGCNPMSLSLLLSHNLNNSSVFSKFLLRNGKTTDGKFYIKYKSYDKSWHGIQRFYGLGRDGVSFEDWTIFCTLSCNKDFWKLSFVVNAQNETTSKNYQTKFILDIPSDLICDDNNISTNIKFNIRSGGYRVFSTPGIKVSSRRMTNNVYKGVNVFVDGFYNSYTVYYDNLGLFNDLYWLDVPFELNINPRSKKEMPTTDLQSIF